MLDEFNTSIAVTGSAGLGLANHADLSFVQEVFATTIGVKKAYPKTDTVIELGGEDAKIIFSNRWLRRENERKLRWWNWFIY